MNAKLKKSLNIAAAAIFVVGLAINIQMSLDDPFETVSAMALAQQTGTGDSGDDDGSGGTTTKYYYPTVRYCYGAPGVDAEVVAYGTLCRETQDVTNGCVNVECPSGTYDLDN